MRLENTDKELFDLCKNSVDLNLIKSKIKSLSSEFSVIIINTSLFYILYTDALKEILEFVNVYTLDSVEGFEHKQIDISDINYDIYLVSLELFAIYRDIQTETVRNNLQINIKGFYEPLAEAFAKASVEYTPKLIRDSFKENRKYKISFVILSGLNNSKSLEIMLESFKKYTPPDKDIEVIVVVNGSSDESIFIPGKILGTKYRLKVINLPQNLGIAGGFNEGIDVADGEYICILQDDITFSMQNWARELAYYLDKYNDIGLVGGYAAIYLYKKNIDHFLEAPLYAYGGNCEFWAFMKTNLVEAHVSLCMAMMFRKGICKFDENFLSNGIEDQAFCFDIRKKGYNVYTTDVGIHHNHGLESTTRRPKKVNVEKIFNNDFINKEIKKFIHQNKGKRVCFYGAGVLAEELVKRYDFSEIKIAGFIDANKAKKGQKIGKYEIYSLDDIETLKIETIALSLLMDKSVKQTLSDYINHKNLKIEVISLFKDYALALNPTYLLSRAYHFKYLIDNYSNIIQDLSEDIVSIEDCISLKYFEKSCNTLPKDYNIDNSKIEMLQR
ncbi:MAG: glycosyltransferase [Candidatus Gastranaerophilaceae bacterium]|jgi:GT2 family glycosyltransferase